MNDTKAEIWNRPEIQEGRNEIYPACLPRIDEEYPKSNRRLWVAGWGLIKQRVLSDVSHFCKKNPTYIFFLSISQTYSRE